MWIRQDGSHLEHLTGTFAIRGSDERSVDVLESALLEELMGRVGEVVADAAHGADQVCARSQVRDFSQVLVGVLLLRQGVLASVAVANDLRLVASVGLGDLHFEQLALGGALDESALELKRGAHVGLGQLSKGGLSYLIGHHYLFITSTLAGFKTISCSHRQK